MKAWRCPCLINRQIMRNMVAKMRIDKPLESEEALGTVWNQEQTQTILIWEVFLHTSSILSNINSVNEVYR